MSEVLDIIEIGAAKFPSARGRKAAPLTLTKLRDLTDADALAISEGNLPSKDSHPAPIKTIRATHHALARLLAQGVRDGEASAITGYCPSRISILKQDPTFSELISYYSSQVEEKFLDTHERLAKLGQSFIDEIQERLEAAPEEFSIGQLYGGAELCLDRSSAPPKGKGPGGGANPQGAAPPQIAITFVTPAPAEPLRAVQRVEDQREQVIDGVAVEVVGR